MFTEDFGVEMLRSIDEINSGLSFYNRDFFKILACEKDDKYVSDGEKCSKITNNNRILINGNNKDEKIITKKVIITNLNSGTDISVEKNHNEELDKIVVNDSMESEINQVGDVSIGNITSTNDIKHKKNAAFDNEKEDCNKQNIKLSKNTNEDTCEELLQNNNNEKVGDKQTTDSSNNVEYDSSEDSNLNCINDPEYNTKGLSEIEKSNNERPYTVFSTLQQNVIFAVIIFVGFLGPMSGNIYIPALPILEREFNVSTTTINSTVSVFIAMFSIGPLVWALYADYGGRKFLYLCSIGMSIVVNLLLALLPANIVSLFILRIIQAFASSSVISLGAGTVSDITSPKNRGKAIAFFMLGPNAGPIIAPVMAGLILMNNEYWRWLFAFTFIASLVGFCMVCVFLPETLRCIVGNGDVRWKIKEVSEATYESDIKQPKLLMCKNFGIQKPFSASPEFKTLYPRPPKPNIKMFWEILKIRSATICSISTALLFATYYGFSVTFSHYLKNDYNYSNLLIGACYACPGAALMVGSITAGYYSDYYRKKYLLQHSDKIYPCHKRLLSQLIGLMISMIGCIGYGWSINFHFHISLVLVFAFTMALGMNCCLNSTMTYLTESNPKRAVGSVAISNSFRNIAAAISSAIIYKLCDLMSVGWCFTGLGLCDILSMIGIYYVIKNGDGSTKLKN